MRKVIKIILYIFVSLLLLLASLMVGVNSQWGQNIIRGKAEAYLNKKLGTEVKIGFFGVGFPKNIVLRDVLVRDKTADTLLSLHLLKVDIAMLGLLHRKVLVQQAEIDGVHGHIYRNAPDTTFNFSYIVAAFAGAKKKKVTDTTAKQPFSIEVNRVLCSDIHFRLDDATGGSFLAANLATLKLNMGDINLDSMYFHVRSLSVAGLQTSYRHDSSLLPKHPTKETPSLKLVADNVHLDDINFLYTDDVNRLVFGVDVGSLLLQLDKFDLSSNTVAVHRLELKNTYGNLALSKQSKTPAVVDTLVKIDSTEGWNVSGGDILLSGVSFVMDNRSVPKVAQGIDYNHLALSGLDMNLRNLQYSGSRVAGNLEHLAVKEQSGVELQELKTRFDYNETGATLNNLYLQTPSTLIRNKLSVHYPNLASLKKNPGAMQLDIDVNKSVIGFHDVLIFVPQLRKQEIFARYPNAAVRIDAQCSGSINNLNIAKLYVLTMNSTEVDVKGRISGLPDAKKMSYNLHFNKLTSGREAIKDYVADTLLKAVRLPDRFNIVGNVAGTLKNYTTDIAINSTDGFAYLKGYLYMAGGKGKALYHLQLHTDKLQVGRILKKDSLLGELSATIAAEGIGFDPKTMTASVSGAIDGAYIKKYRYKNVIFAAKTKEARAIFSLSSADPNVRVDLNASADFSGKFAALQAGIRVDSLDLRALHFSDSEFRVKGIITADVPVLDPDYPVGSVSWVAPSLVVKGKSYVPDSLYVVSAPVNGVQHINARLDALHATINGSIPLTKAGAVIAQRINTQMAAGKLLTDTITPLPSAGTNKAIKPTDTISLPKNYDLSIEAYVVDQPIIRAFLPQLIAFDTIQIHGKITPKILRFSANIPSVAYGSNILKNAIAKVNGTDSAFAYSLKVEQLGNAKLSLWYADVHGNLQKNNISAFVSTSDSLHRERFAIAAVMQQDSLRRTIKLLDGLKLNYNTWQVTPDNSIVLEKAGYFVNNLKIANNEQLISVASERQTPKAPLRVNITDFNLDNIASIIGNSDTPLISGIVGGTVVLEQGPKMQINGEMAIAGLKFMGTAVGDIKAKANNRTANAIATDVTIVGQGNDIAITGNYYQQAQNGSNLDFKVAVNALALQSVEKLAMGQIKNSSGYIRGAIDVSGTIKEPLFQGSLKTERLKTTVAAINSQFSFPAEQIGFSGNTVTFNNFNIVDSPLNMATLDGTVNISELTNPRFDLSLKAKNWRAVHSTQADNKSLYGDLFMTANLKVNGTPKAPVIDGTLNVLKGTKLTVVAPEKTPQLESHKGIVVFINPKDTARATALRSRKRDTIQRQVAVGSEVNVNVTVDKNAQFSLILDQLSGDFISVRGTASLNTSVSKSGVIGLTGNYELEDGIYQLNYNLIKRKFLIRSGSTISFAGDPVTGTNMDITAVYEAVAAPYDLVQRQVPDQAQLNYYKQRIPFDVLLHLKGPVLQPAISFDLSLPENKVYPLSADQVELVKSTLVQVRTDTSQLNKQVFAVLILNRFVADDPFKSGAAQSISSTAMQSVSTFIGEQLNQAAGKLVKGVDLSVDLATTDDYTTGDQRQRTDLSLAASKRLLDDRLKLTVGNNFELEGPQATNQEPSYIPSNLAADYLLSPDGKYTLRAYRKGYNKGVLEGYVTETGLNFIVNLDYNRFSNFYRKPRNRNIADTSTTIKPKR